MNINSLTAQKAYDLYIELLDKRDELEDRLCQIKEDIAELDKSFDFGELLDED